MRRTRRRHIDIGPGRSAEQSIETQRNSGCQTDSVQTDGDCAALGRAITARMSELGLTSSELDVASGIGEAAIDRYIAGYGRKHHRVPKLHALSLALWWTPDSAERVLERGEPIEADKPPVESNGKPHAWLIDEVVRLRLQNEDLTQRLDHLQRRLRQLTIDDGSAIHD